MTATVDHSAPAPGSSTAGVLAWLRLGTITAPLLVVFFAIAAVEDAILRFARAGREGREQGPAARAERRQGGSAVLVPAEVWAQSGVAIRQDDEAAVDRR